MEGLVTIVGCISMYNKRNTSVSAFNQPGVYFVQHGHYFGIIIWRVPSSISLTASYIRNRILNINYQFSI